MHFKNKGKGPPSAADPTAYQHDRQFDANHLQPGELAGDDVD
jgi:hypothetical protein